MDLKKQIIYTVQFLTHVDVNLKKFPDEYVHEDVHEDESLYLEGFFDR